MPPSLLLASKKLLLAEDKQIITINKILWKGYE